MVGNGGVHRLDGHEPSVLDQLAEQLRVMDDLVRPTERRVLVREAVEAVRAGGHDLLRGRGVEDLDVGLGHLLVQVLVAEPPGRITGARLARAEDGERHPGGVQQFGERPGDLLGPVFDGAGAAHPVQVLDIVGDGLAVVQHADVERQTLGPLGADPGRDTPRVAVVLQVAQHHAGLAREGRLDHHLIAAHVDDVVDMLDVDGTLLDAGTAVGAGPQDVGVDDPAFLLGTDERPIGLRLTGLGDPPEARLGYVVDGVLRRRVRGAGGRRGSGAGAGRGFVAVPGAVGCEQVRRLGEEMVTQIHDQKLR